MSGYCVSRVLVVMGVAGSGKSTLGAMLAEHLACPFYEADDYHPTDNVDKMSRGIALNDTDRWPWLDALGQSLGDAAQQSGQVVASCSALRLAYRQRLMAAVGEPVLFVYLRGSEALIAKRMGMRTDHFMPMGLLRSQFETLEEPGCEENALVVDIAGVSAKALGERLYALCAKPKASV